MNQDYAAYQQEYDQCLSKVRSFLSSNARSLTTLRECERLLSEARRCATAMEQLAEESGDAFKINESKRRIQQEITPLVEEVQRTTQDNANGGNNNGSLIHQQQQQRAELFSGYRAPTIDNDGDDMEMLIRNSEDLLLESQALCAESEQTGSETLNLMGRQREQLQGASDHLVGARAYFTEAGDILKAMTRKAIRNKRFLQFIILILIIANITVFVAMVKKKRRRGRYDDDSV